MRYLTLIEVLELHEAVIASSGGAPGIRDIGELESAVSQPRLTFEQADLYPDGSVFDIVEGIMDDLYHIQTCGCIVLPGQGYGKGGLAAHVGLNMAFYLLPVGQIVFLKRRMKG